MTYSQQDKEEALKRRDLSLLTNMINDNVDINTLIVPKITDVLLVAITKEHRTLFNIVLEKNFDCKKHGFLYVHHAIRTHDQYFIEAMINYYIKNNINFNEYNSEKNNGLHIAVGEENITENILIYLTNVGIKWEEKNIFGQTPLHILLRKKESINEKIIELIVNKKELLKIKDNLNISPKDIIESAENSDWAKNNQKLIDLIKKKI